MLKPVKPRSKKPKKPYYDEKDKAALKKMTKDRVVWSSQEDSLVSNYILIIMYGLFLF